MSRSLTDAARSSAAVRSSLRHLSDEECRATAVFRLARLKEQIQAIVTALSLVNPVICGMMFAQAEAGRSLGERWADSTKAALAILVIFVAAALAGTKLLQLFGVSLDAFMVAGGGMLAWMGFSMLSNRPAVSTATVLRSESRPGAHTFDCLCRQPGNHNWSHHHLRCPHPNAVPADLPCGNRRSDPVHLAGHAVVCAYRRQRRRWRTPAGYGDAHYLTDRPVHRSSVRTHRISCVHALTGNRRNTNARSR